VVAGLVKAFGRFDKAKTHYAKNSFPEGQAPQRRGRSPKLEIF
jgi:hypothetical protein